ncbi:MAG: ribonuclease P protein component [Clostridia bacterium]|nr:ribonuclease P protein component [Clostridia bacterium]
MLSKQNRLKKRKEFGYIYKNGEAFHSKSVTLYAIDSKFKTLKIGFSVSKKVGKAYLRNKIKRQLRSIIREELSKLQDHKNYILVAKTAIAELGYDEIRRDVLYVLGKVNKNHEPNN